MADLEIDGANSKAKINKVQTDSGSTLTLGQSGDTVTLGSGATLGSVFDSTQTVNWSSTIITTATTLVSGNGYFVNTTSGAITVTLPASPSVGDYLQIKDYAGTFGTNNLTIARNSSNIQGLAADSIIQTNRAALKLVYADATKGWLYVEESNIGDLQKAGFVTATGGTITTSGDYKIHTFNSSGTFTVTDAGNPLGSDTVDYLVIAGGGGALNSGAGAGGLRESVPSPAAWPASPLANPGGALPVSAQAYPVTVGSGGSGGAGLAPDLSNNGNPSTFSTITSAGGGASASGGPVGTGGPGGSGGGGANPGRAGGSGNVPSVSPPQGRNGGTGHPNGYPSEGTGGGGGAGANGSNGGPGSGGSGGNGVSSSISGSSVTRAGGGGGWGRSSSASGGSGGGGNGGPGGSSTGGAANTGGGAGGDDGNPRKSGGSGVVIIRYKFQ
jgi:hypothetical protein